MDLSTSGLELWVGIAGAELMFFASVGILLFGLDDLLFDLIWLMSPSKRKAADDFAGILPGVIAVFVPAWDEACALPAMLRRTLAAWDGEDFRIYVGCYPNDPSTILAISDLVARDRRLRLVIGSDDGPTTKGANLNHLWNALGEDERAEGMRFSAIVLHDAEDHVHPEELGLYRAHLSRCSMVQIPVVPFVLAGAQWVGGHYADEFAEAHAKELTVRTRLGAPIPSAGVGCAMTRRALSLVAIDRGGEPFRTDSLTEDYELGMIFGAYGLSTAFVDSVGSDGSLIASRGSFPGRIDTAVRQKARWIAGIAFDGWDHIGWPGSRIPNGSRGGGWIARWMLWRDRRPPLAALVLLAAYLGSVVTLAGLAGQAIFGWRAPAIGELLRLLVFMGAILLLWRLGMRIHFSARWYGWRQGVLAVPRAFVSNLVAILAARRALVIYWHMLRSGRVVWDKTDHRDTDSMVEAMYVQRRRPG